MLCLLQIKACRLRPFKARPPWPRFNFQISRRAEKRYNPKRASPDLVILKKQPKTNKEYSWNLLEAHFCLYGPCLFVSYFPFYLLQVHWKNYRLLGAWLKTKSQTWTLQRGTIQHAWQAPIHVPSVMILEESALEPVDWNWERYHSRNVKVKGKQYGQIMKSVCLVSSESLENTMNLSPCQKWSRRNGIKCFLRILHWCSST